MTEPKINPAPAPAAKDSPESFLPQSTVLLVDDNAQNLELLTRVKSLLRVRHLKSELERALTYLNEIEQEDDEVL